MTGLCWKHHFCHPPAVKWSRAKKSSWRLTQRKANQWPPFSWAGAAPHAQLHKHSCEYRGKGGLHGSKHCLGVSSAAPHLSKAHRATALGVASPCTNYILKQRKEKENTENRLLRKGRFSLPYGYPLCCGSAYAKLLMNYYFSCQIHTLLQLIPWLLCGWVSDTEGAGRWDEIFSIIPHSDHTENGRKTPPHLKLDSSQHCKSCILGKKLHLQILSFPWDVNFY